MRMKRRFIDASVNADGARTSTYRVSGTEDGPKHCQQAASLACTICNQLCTMLDAGCSAKGPGLFALAAAA